MLGLAGMGFYHLFELDCCDALPKEARPGVLIFVGLLFQTVWQNFRSAPKRSAAFRIEIYTPDSKVTGPEVYAKLIKEGKNRWLYCRRARSVSVVHP